MKLIRKVVIPLALAFSISTSVFAQISYVDVPESHWAYEAVQEVTEKKWMTGNLQNEFKPSNLIDYFYFSGIVAKIAGYKDPLVNSDVSEEEKQYANEAYLKYKGVLTRYNTRFSRWNEQYKNYNEEIAYLLHKGILEEEDLAKFIVEQEDGSEAVISLRREDMAVYVVRLIGKETEALNKYSTTKFLDDALIIPKAKPYVAYLAKSGVFQEAETIKFNPKDKVSKAVLAKVLVDSLGIKSNGEASSNGSNNTNDSNNSNGSNDSTNPEVYLQGDITFFKSGYIGIQSGNKISYYPIKDDAGFFIGDMETNMESIKVGDNVFIQLEKEDNTDRVIRVTKSEQDISNPQNTNNPNDQDSNNPPTNDTSDNNMNIPSRTVEGIIKSVDGAWVDISVKYINYKGEISEKVETYRIDNDSAITKNSKNIIYQDIQPGDIIVSEVKGNIIYKAKVMESRREVNGSLVEKKHINGSNMILLEVDGDIAEYYIEDNVSISKKGIDKAVWNDLRTGDKIVLNIEYDKVISLWAEGFKSRVEGVIQEVLISSNQSKITLKLNDGTIKVYPLIYGAGIVKDRSNEMLTLYDIRLGQEAELYLDSFEIEELVAKEQSMLSTVQGYIENIDFANNYMDIRTNSDFIGTKRIHIEKDVEVFQGDRRLSRRDLKENMLVVITMKTYGGNYAEIINILAN